MKDGFVEFNFSIKKDYEELMAKDLINQPIIGKDWNAIGIILEAELNNDKLHFNCKGIIWNRYICPEYIINNQGKRFFHGIVIV